MVSRTWSQIGEVGCGQVEGDDIIRWVSEGDV